jgi:hypothetical protein
MTNCSSTDVQMQSLRPVVLRYRRGFSANARSFLCSSAKFNMNERVDFVYDDLPRVFVRHCIRGGPEHRRFVKRARRQLSDGV